MGFRTTVARPREIARVISFVVESLRRVPGVVDVTGLVDEADVRDRLRFIWAGHGSWVRLLSATFDSRPQALHVQQALLRLGSRNERDWQVQLVEDAREGRSLWQVELYTNAQCRRRDCLALLAAVQAVAGRST